MNATAWAATIEENSILDLPGPLLTGKSLLYNPNGFIGAALAALSAV
jgi:hypothetical protein